MTLQIRGRRYQPVIGLEIHVQLATRSKMFCGCGTGFDAEPNQQVCPVCLGFPGSLPVPNREAVALATRLALALGAVVHPRSVFDRKSYFYPDLPKGYQITQQHHPLATGGAVVVDGRRIELERLHLEEDAGRSSHVSGGASLVDLNRAGLPLVEIVSLPQLRAPSEAAAFMKEVRRIVRYLGVSDGNMEQGSLRCDANVSLGDLDSDVPGARVELKNMNSFKFVSQALEYEIARHTAELRQGRAVARETRSFDAQRGASVFMRSKEDAHDYRFFPDPDLPALVLDAQFIEAERGRLIELPSDRALRYQRDWGLSEYDAGVLTADRDTADWFEQGVAAIAPDARHEARTKALANLVMGEVARRLNSEGRGIASLPFGPERLVQLGDLVDDGVLSGELARRVLGALWEADADPARVAAERGWRQVSDAGALDAVIRRVLSSNPGELARLRAGQAKLRGFFVGQVMRETGGSANPSLVNQRLDALLTEPGGD